MTYRIICRKLLILIRLVIIVSLAGYSLSNASAAMHSPGSAGIQQSDTFVSDHHASDMTSHDHDGGDGQDGDANKLLKQKCCGDYCVSMVLPIGHVARGGPAIETVRFSIDDSKAVGQVTTLHRPPSL